MHTIRTLRAAALASAALLLVAACDANTPLPTESQAAPPGGLSLKSAQAENNPQLAQQLAELKQLTAKYHDFAKAHEDYPILLTNEVFGAELTSPDGCVSDATAGGMGYHYLGSVALDGEVDYRTPEVLVFAPTNGAAAGPDGPPGSRLAAFDYFIPYAAWPEEGPAPTSEDLGLAIDPAIPFAHSRFGGWMFHIWPWENNPAGMFANWNPAVPLCTDSPF